MKVLIAGGTGLIGSALAPLLRSNGHQVTILSRTPSRVDQDYGAVSWQESDLVSAISETDAVVNLAGESMAGSSPLQMRWTEKRKKGILSSRVTVGKALQAAIEKSASPPTTLVQASAIGYYGNTGAGPVDETSPPGNDFLSRVCLDWEESTAGVEQLGIRRVIIRIGLVLSQQGGLLPLLALPHRLYLGGPLGSGDQPMSWIHIDDVTGSIQFFLDNPQLQGTFNLTTPSPTTNRDFSLQLGQTLGKPSWLKVPAFAFKLLLGEAATLALEGRPVHPARLQDAGFTFKYPDLTSALDSLLG